MQTVWTLIIRRVLLCLIWVFTVCQCPFYGTLSINGLNAKLCIHSQDTTVTQNTWFLLCCQFQNQLFSELKYCTGIFFCTRHCILIAEKTFDRYHFRINLSCLNKMNLDMIYVDIEICLITANSKTFSGVCTIHNYLRKRHFFIKKKNKLFWS